MSTGENTGQEEGISAEDLEIDEKIANVRKDVTSVFLSYAWDSRSHRDWVRRLGNDLDDLGFTVYADYKQDMIDNPGRAWAVGGACQNIVVIATEKYMDSALIGKAAQSYRHSPFPSFAITHAGERDDGFVTSVKDTLEVAEMAWARVERNLRRGRGDIATRQSILKWLKSKVSTFRIFSEGWSLDELQLIQLNQHKYRSILTVYRSGRDCFSSFPVVEFSDHSQYMQSLHALGGYLEKAANGKVRIRFRKNLCSKGVTYWRPCGKTILTIRPNVVLDERGSPFLNGQLTGAILQPCHDWERDGTPIAHV